jgi:site-specific DNA-methyltransferase (cytosine-N4-specific)
MRTARILVGDVRARLRDLPDASVQCCVTSPPYWGAQRDYSVAGQLGMEREPWEFVEVLIDVFWQVRRVLKDDGCMFLNIGDSYAASGKGGGGSMMRKRHASWAHRSHLTGWRKQPPGYKQKDLVGVPWGLAYALREDGWYLRRDVIWDKGSPTEPPRSDRPSGSHEFLFLMAKRKDYRCDATKLPKGSVWRVHPSGSYEEHAATFPENLIEPCIMAATSEGETVIDPFCGSGTTGVVACRHNRHFIGVELNPQYAALAEKRITGDAGLLNRVEVA